jgi:hypothetical protein
MTVFTGAVDATFAAFDIDALYTPASGEPVSVRVIARRPDAIVGFGETRIHAETATFEVRASEVTQPRPGDQLTVAARPSSSRASRSAAILIGSCGAWTFGQPDVVRLQPGAVLWRPQGESSAYLLVSAGIFSLVGLLGRVGAPEEVAETTLRLLSDAATLVAGTVVQVSGGR